MQKWVGDNKIIRFTYKALGYFTSLLLARESICIGLRPLKCTFKHPWSTWRGGGEETRGVMWERQKPHMIQVRFKSSFQIHLYRMRYSRFAIRRTLVPLSPKFLGCFQSLLLERENILIGLLTFKCSFASPCLSLLTHNVITLTWKHISKCCLNAN